MTQFDITYTDFKREDTTNDITIKLYGDNKRPITPNSSHTWKAKVAKGDKYVGEYPVTIFGNTLKLSSSNLTRLPDGNYSLELWETYGGSTAIYPSTGVMTFRVNKNLDDTLGTIDPTTDINAIIDDLHKAGQNIKVVATNTLPAGSKASVTQSITNGENQLTFNIPQGETNETATNALAVANSVDSKVIAIQTTGGGRNLLQGTGTVSGDVGSKVDGSLVVKGAFNGYDAVKTNTAWREQFINLKSALGRINAKVGDWLTLSVYVKADKQIDTGWLGDYRVSDDDVFREIQMSDKPITTQWQQYSWNFQISDASLQRKDTRIEYNSGTGDNWIYWAGWMLEKGTVAHDWQPAPEDAPSNDSQLVHKTNNETIAGDKTFVGNTTLATTTILEGNYGLRVTSSGIQKTTDGKTWVPANI